MSTFSKRVLLVAAVGIAAGGAFALTRVLPGSEGPPPGGDLPDASAPEAMAPEPDAGNVSRDAAPKDREAEAPKPPPDEQPAEPEAQREQLFETMRQFLGLDEPTLGRVRKIVEASRLIGQGNPKVTTHPMTRSECRTIRASSRVVSGQPELCGAPNMVPLGAASVCIDQFEFPNIPCEYPVVFARAKEAAELCRAVGKRLCDAHEWEGGCAGELRAVADDYAFGETRGMMRHRHNRARAVVWAYGPKQDHSLCATGSAKSRGCVEGGYKRCGSNTYPAGAFPKCVSAFGVYDQHGNAAEHMNLPLGPEQLTARGGLGATEMKGSWFFFGTLSAHDDDCRWRAPNWHGTTVDDVESHRNYHLGFRCCRDVGPAASPG